MAKLVLVNAMVLVNSVDISNHVQQATINDSRAEVDVTSMGDTNQEIVLGLGDSTITITVFNDYAVGNMDAQMWPLHVATTAFPVEVRPVNAARSTSNPAYILALAWLPQYNPIDGSVGAAVTTPLVFRNGGPAGLTRLTA